MSFTIPRRARYLTFAGLSTLALAVGAQVAVTPSAVSLETYTVPLHQPTPITNSGYGEQENDCSGSPAQWGWHFVLPGNDSDFVSLTTTFQSAGTIVTTDFGKNAKHAYVYTPTDDTLLSASAEVTGGEVEFFNLSHVCAGGGTTPTGTPSVTPSETVSATVSTTPSETVSATVSTTPSETVSVTPSETVSATVSTTPSETVSATVSTTPSETVSATVSTTPSETVSATVSATASETLSETPSPTVSGVVFTNTPTASVGGGTQVSRTPSVQGVRQTRGPVVRGTRLADTGTPVPVALLLLLGFGLLFGGVVTTVAAEAPGSSYQARHRRR